MSRITDAQVEVAEGAYFAVYRTGLWSGGREGEIAAMRAALEAYERVRDFAAIYRNAVAEQQESKKCLARIGNDLCTRDVGHSGEHRCLASDVDVAKQKETQP